MAILTGNKLNEALHDMQSSRCKLVLAEKQGNGKVVARGTFAEAGVPTGNNRIYPKDIWERELKSIQDDVNAGKITGTLDHPADGKTRLSDVSHKITSLRLEGDTIIGEAEILDTSRGRDLKALIEGGVMVGVSSRGTGSVKANSEGKEVVQEDFKFMTFDFVGDPANMTAYPSFFAEAREAQERRSKTMADEVKAESLTLESLKADHADLVKAIKEETSKEIEEGIRSDERTKTRDSLRGQFEVELLDRIGESREEVAKEVKSAYLSDPEVAQSQGMLNAIKRILSPAMLADDAKKVVEDKNAEMVVKDVETKKISEELKIAKARVEGLEAEIAKRDHALEKASALTKELGFKLYAEQKLAGNPDRDTIFEFVGNPAQYNDIKELDEKLKTAAEKAKKLREDRTAVKNARRVEEEKVVEKTKAVVAENKKLKDAAAESLEMAHGLALRMYATEQTEGNPKKHYLRKLCESAKSRADIDKILSEVKASPDGEPSPEYRNLKEKLARGVSKPILTEESHGMSDAMRIARKYSGLPEK